VTQNAAFKRAVRARMAATAETYQQARRALLAQHTAPQGPPPRPPSRPLARGGQIVGTVMMSWDLAELKAALATFGQPTELLVAFGAEDLVFKASLNPAQFAGNGMIWLSNCLLANADSQWLSVEGPNCGYLGEGPNKTIELLKHLGVERCADDVLQNRYVRFDLSSGSVVERSSDPISRLSIDGQEIVNGVTIVRLHPENNFRGDDWLEPGESTPFNAYLARRNGGGNTLKHWCVEVLNAPDRPVWAAGTPRARCYLSYEAVHAAGLRARPRWQWMSVPTLVIEQGDLQLWCDAGVAHDRRALLSRQTERALELVGLPIPHENRRQRLLRRARGAPQYIDLDEDGGGLRHNPAALANGAASAREIA
jgi:hypothetical protein